MLMRSFTRREKVLLVLLAVIVLIGIYVLAVRNPTRARVAELEAESEDLDLQTDMASAMLMRYTAMQLELEEIKSMPADRLTYMPDYANNRQEELFARFNGIFLGMDPRITFPEVRFQDGIATRPVDFDFEAAEYAQIKPVLSQLTRTGQRSLLDGLSINPSNPQASHSLLQGPVKVHGTIYFYELATRSAATEG